MAWGLGRGGEKWEEDCLIQILLPLRVKYFPQGLGTAEVRIEAASEPLEGSVRQNAAMVSPVGQKAPLRCAHHWV